MYFLCQLLHYAFVIILYKIVMYFFWSMYGQVMTLIAIGNGMSSSRSSITSSINNSKSKCNVYRFLL